MTIEITRITTVNILKHIEPHLSFTNPANRLPFLEEFVQLMSQAPESLMVLAAIESDEPESPVKAFIIAQNPGFKVPYILLAQSWSDSENSWELAQRVFVRLVMWAVSLGKTEIRGETQRSTEAIYRRFGFKSISQVMGFDLCGIQPRLVESIKEAL